MNEGICSVEGCEREVRAKGFCQPHYMRMWRRGEVADRSYPTRDPVCSVEGCEKPHKAQGFCQAHYKRWQQTGDPGEAHVSGKGTNQGKTCAGPECDRPAHSLGLCPAHYWQQTNGKPLTPLVTKGKVPRGTPCWVGEPVVCGKPSLAMDGVCRIHYQRRLANEPDWDRPVQTRAEKGSGHVDKQGYRIITVDGKAKREHLHIAEELLGRPLLKRVDDKGKVRAVENVHHIWGSRADNRTDGPFRIVDGKLRSGNLEVWSSAQPAGQAVPDKLDFGLDLLELYVGQLDEARWERLAAIVAQRP